MVAYLTRVFNEFLKDGKWMVVCQQMTGGEALQGGESYRVTGSELSSGTQRGSGCGTGMF